MQIIYSSAKIGMMMNFRLIEKPAAGEYPPYSSIYMDLMKDDGQVLRHLHDNFFKIKYFITGLPDEQLAFRYEAGKWSTREILVHLIDDERIFAYRALRYGRSDHCPLPGFDQDNYNKYARANERSLESILDEYEAVRMATLLLFQYLPDEALNRSGAILDNGKVTNMLTVRALAYHIAGHELWHIKIIKERYLNLSTVNGII